MIQKLWVEESNVFAEVATKIQELETFQEIVLFVLLSN